MVGGGGHLPHYHDRVHKTFVIHLPLLPLPDFGADGTDAATIFAAIGLIGLLLELAKIKRSTLTLVATVPLLFSPSCRASEPSWSWWAHR